MTIRASYSYMVNHNWKYFYIHNWIKRNYGKATYCSIDKSHKSKRFEWSNLSGEYLKDIKDFRQLCCSCHRKIDYTDEQREKVRLSLIGTHRKAKKIKQFDKFGNFIKEWKSSADVERKLGILHHNISQVLAGKSKTAGGFRWSR